MAEIALLPSEIDDALDGGTTVLTSNQRAARTLRQRFDLRNCAKGLTHWESPAILPWDAWIAALWRQLLLAGHTSHVLLNRTQEHTLWRTVIAGDPESVGLRSADGLAEMAADAYGRLCAYRGEGRLRSAGISADTRAFQRWATAFERRCRAASYLPQAQLEATLTDSIGQLTLAPEGYLLVGFDHLTPAQGALLEALARRGVDAALLGEATAQETATLVATPDEATELKTAARYLRHHLEQHPDARVALIVPDLENTRAALDRTLRLVLAPELEDITATGAAPFEFSLGVPLASTPLVAAALDLLQWTTRPLAYEKISQLLLSSYFAGGMEQMARASFDAYELRRAPTLRPELSVEAFARIAESSQRANRLPYLIGALKNMRRTVTAEGIATESRPAADWADAIRALLDAAGWNGARADNSVEFQTRRKWEALLDELATLDFEGIRLTWADALAAILRLARQTLFAPESRNAPVQIMSPLEAAGSTFDCVWFLRAGDLTWPQPPSASPLLAFHLQRELHMPGANPAEDAAHARRITGRLLASASSVFVSYAERVADGSQRSSPALAGLPLAPEEDFLPVEPAEAPVALEACKDSTTLPPTPDKVLRGGANLLKLQAACGFRAFAEQRLFATALDTAEPGLDARERGNAVHLALQHFWSAVRDQETLSNLTEEDRHTHLAAAIEYALAKPERLSITDWDAAYLEIQRQRLFELLDPWLLSELGREVPFTVTAQETEIAEARIGPLRLKLRVDRIDSTEHGNVILDYKTGEAKPSAWLTDRPDEPQLPLYAVLAASDHLAGVAYAQVRPGKDRNLSGYQTQDGILLKPIRLKAPTLGDQVEEWYRILTQLAEEFHRGDVRVRPKQYPTTCEHCAQRILCRLDITLLEDAAPEESPEESDRA